jgi:hypothetical protein
MDGLPLSRLGPARGSRRSAAAAGAAASWRIVALGAKILVICWGMLKTNTPFRQSAITPALASPAALE